tara:strand:- start:591 stop:869 length:279 start_codon:yes stop_codon:yes gene_type:complete
MKKIMTIYVYPIAIFIAIAVFPIPNTVMIHKDNVKAIYAFAGEIDQGNGRQYVSVEVCTQYWLEKDQQPDVRYVRTCRLGLIGLLFGFGFNY